MASALDLLSAAALLSGAEQEAAVHEEPQPPARHVVDDSAIDPALAMDLEPVVSPESTTTPAVVVPQPLPPPAPLGDADWQRISAALASGPTINDLDDADKTDEDEDAPPPLAFPSKRPSRGSAHEINKDPHAHQQHHHHLAHPHQANSVPLAPPFPPPSMSTGGGLLLSRAPIAPPRTHFGSLAPPVRLPPLQLFTDSSGAATLAVSAPLSSFPTSSTSSAAPTSASTTFTALPPLPPLPSAQAHTAVAAPLPPQPTAPPAYAVPEDSGIIRCVCPFTADDGFTIQCDTCNVWQHAGCVAISLDDVPEEYRCEMCDPAGASDRRVDKVRAEEGMRMRMAIIEREARVVAMRANGAFGVGMLGSDEMGMEVERELREQREARPSKTTVGDQPYRPSKSKKPNSSGPSPTTATPLPVPLLIATTTTSQGVEEPIVVMDGVVSTADGTVPIVTSAPVTTASGVVIGRKRRVAKQPGVSRSKSGSHPTPTAAHATPSTSLSGSSAPGVTSTPHHDSTSTATSAPGTINGPELTLAPFPPRPASFGVTPSRGGGGTTTSGAPSDDEDSGGPGDDRYEMWQYEFTPVERNLFSGRTLVERIEKVLRVVDGEEKDENAMMDADDEDDEDPTTWSQLRQLRARQEETRPRTGPSSKDGLLPIVYSHTPYVSLPSLPPSLPLSVKPLASTTFHLVAPVASTYVPTSTQAPICPYPRPTVHALFSTAPIPSGSFIAPLHGRISTIEEYRRDPLNQYAELGLPKQGVRFVAQPWSLAIDQRMWGNEVRFARSGCHPNAVVRVIRLEDDQTTTTSSARANDWASQRLGTTSTSQLAFALFSTCDIPRREEIILPWDWDDSHIAHALPSLMSGTLPPPLTSISASDDLERLSRKMSVVTSSILGGGGGNQHCACEKKKDCVLFWMCRAAGCSTLSLTRRSEGYGANGGGAGAGGGAGGMNGHGKQREPFATILLNALGGGGVNGAGNGGKDEMMVGQKGGAKSRKQKRPELGPLLGLERGWVLKKEVEKIVEVVPEPIEEETEEKVEVEPMEVDEVVEEKVAVASEPVAMDVEPTAPASLEAPHPFADGNDSDGSDLTEPLSHPSDDENDTEDRTPAPDSAIDTADDNDDGDSDEGVVRPPQRRKLLSGSSTPKGRLVPNSKEIGPGSKKLKLALAKAAEKAKEKESKDDAGPSTAANKLKRKKGASGIGLKGKGVERERKKIVVFERKIFAEKEKEKEPEPPKVEEEPKEKEQPPSKKVKMGKHKTPKLRPPSRSPSPEPTPPPPASVDAPSANEESSTAAPADATSREPTPPPAPPRRISLKEYQQRRKSDSVATSEDQPPSTSMNAAEDVVMADGTKDDPVVPAPKEPTPPPKEPTPPPKEPTPPLLREPTPPPPPPPVPRVRLSLAAYRQRQAQKPAEPATPSTPAVAEAAPALPPAVTAPAPDSVIAPVPVVAAPIAEELEAGELPEDPIPPPRVATPPKPIAITLPPPVTIHARPPPPTAFDDEAGTPPLPPSRQLAPPPAPVPVVQPTVAAPAPVATLAKTFSSAEDILKSIGDYFGRSGGSASTSVASTPAVATAPPTPAPQVQPPVLPPPAPPATTYVRPPPPRPLSPEPISRPSPPLRPSSSFASEPPSRFPSRSSVSSLDLNTNVGGSNSALGLDTGAPPLTASSVSYSSRDYSRPTPTPSPLPTGPSSYSSSSSALPSPYTLSNPAPYAREHQPPSPGVYVPRAPLPPPPPSSSAYSPSGGHSPGLRPSPPIRPYNSLADPDLPTGPRAMGSSNGGRPSWPPGPNANGSNGAGNAFRGRGGFGAGRGGVPTGPRHVNGPPSTPGSLGGGGARGGGPRGGMSSGGWGTRGRGAPRGRGN